MRQCVVSGLVACKSWDGVAGSCILRRSSRNRPETNDPGTLTKSGKCRSRPGFDGTRCWQVEGGAKREKEIRGKMHFARVGEGTEEGVWSARVPMCVVGGGG